MRTEQWPADGSRPVAQRTSGNSAAGAGMQDRRALVSSSSRADKGRIQLPRTSLLYILVQKLFYSYVDVARDSFKIRYGTLFLTCVELCNSNGTRTSST
jgi:hypothetical protein